MIRLAKLEDAEQICNIYNYYIKNTGITFEEIELTVSQMEDRINSVLDSYPWLVFEEDGKVTGYAYASRWKSRCAYKYSVETSVYVDYKFNGRGIGCSLMKTLITELKKINVHAVIAGIALPNEKSCRLHEKLDFIKVAQFPEVGYKFGQWIDVGYWQLNL